MLTLPESDTRERERILLAEALAGRTTVDWLDYADGVRLGLVRWSDGIAYGVSCELNQWLADLHGARLPTAWRADWCWRHAAGQLDPIIRPAAVIGLTSTMREVSAEHRRRAPGLGDSKCWVIDSKCWVPGLRAVNHGYWIVADEVVGTNATTWRGIRVHYRAPIDAYVIQDRGAAHDIHHADSSQWPWIVIAPDADYSELPGDRHPDVSRRGGPAVASTVPPAPPAGEPQAPTIRRGSKGEAVREWQRRLNAWGVLESNPGALLLIVDGDYGRRTASSTVAFQHAHALAADGIVGPRTWAASEPIPPAPDTLPAPPPSAVGRAEPTVDDFIQARHYTATTGRTINWIVLHSMEGGTARSVARWFGGPSAPQASAHFCVGPVEVIQCVMLENVAWAAPGANAAGVQIEMEGRAMKTDWLNSPVMARTAKLVAELCPYLDIPAQRVTAEGLLRGERGITSHCAVSDAWRKSTHQDPGGPGDRRWPWGAFLEAVRGEPVRASR